MWSRAVERSGGEDGRLGGLGWECRDTNVMTRTTYFKVHCIYHIL
jgi:hypothetical protein